MDFNILRLATGLVGVKRYINATPIQFKVSINLKIGDYSITVKSNTLKKYVNFFIAKMFQIYNV